MKEPKSLIHHSTPSGQHELWLRITAFLSSKSPNTLTTYTQIIREWCLFLGHEAGTSAAAKAIISATDLHSAAYRSWLLSRPGERPRAERRESRSKELQTALSARRARKSDGTESTQSNATIAKKFSALRRIYRMLIANDLKISINPFDPDRVPAPSSRAGRKRPTEMVDFDDVMKIVNAPDLKCERGRRDKALLASLFGGALRRSEAANLRVGDLRTTRNGTYFLYLRATKAKKDAEQAIPSWTAEILKDWHRERLKQGAGSGDYLFISYTGRAGSIRTADPLTTNNIYRIFKSYCGKAGAGGFLSPHSARATAITRLLDSGFSHREVQEFSRHASIQMVEAYDKRRISVDDNPAKDLDFSSKKRR